MTKDLDSTLISLFNQAVREDTQKSKQELLAHWKLVCDFLDGFKAEDNS